MKSLPVKGLSAEQVDHYFRAKILDEAGELFQATEKLDIISKASELVEVIVALLKRNRITEKDIQNFRDWKNTEQGNFSQGLVIEIL